MQSVQVYELVLMPIMSANLRYYGLKTTFTWMRTDLELFSVLKDRLSRDFIISGLLQKKGDYDLGGLNEGFIGLAVNWPLNSLSFTN